MYQKGFDVRFFDGEIMKDKDDKEGEMEKKKNLNFLNLMHCPYK